ncbi:LysR substrate-binding domain-containing protein [Hydrogenophaga sp.]|uniref:LysR substrate-binding domain-containing protein n=1 Tax=Hydrogenophaga sp. TaxID=1904254 RepID=UPI003566C0D7
MKLNQLRAALCVAEKGSLRSAARELGMSQPALTHNIGELERELGAPLFERRSHGMTPTPVGELFLRRAKVIASESRRAKEEVAQFLGSDQGEVVVCLSIVAHLVLLPMALPLFEARFPGVRLRVIEASFPAVEARLRDGSVDFFIGPAPDAGLSREFVLEHLFDNTRAVYARHGHPLAHARSLAELTEARWITTAATDNAEEKFAEVFARLQLPAPRVVAQAESMLSMLMMVMSSDVLAISLRQYHEFPLTRSALQVIDVKEKLPAPRVVIVRRAALPLTPAAEYLADMFRRASVAYLQSVEV